MRLILPHESDSAIPFFLGYVPIEQDSSNCGMVLSIGRLDSIISTALQCLSSKKTYDGNGQEKYPDQFGGTLLPANKETGY